MEAEDSVSAAVVAGAVIGILAFFILLGLFLGRFSHKFVTHVPRARLS